MDFAVTRQRQRQIQRQRQRERQRQRSHWHHSVPLSLFGVFQSTRFLTLTGARKCEDAESQNI